MRYVRPILCGGCKPFEAAWFGEGPLWFDRAEILSRDEAPLRVSITELGREERTVLEQPRAEISGLKWNVPRIMGILNVTPDSFSDGGLFHAEDAARAQASSIVESGADVLDIGGESTRPGAKTVEIEEEIARTAPVITSIANTAPIVSIDTRKASVARKALDAGAHWINDVSAFMYDPAMAAVAVDADVPVCLMHAQGAPETMQNNPRYANVVFDVYDALKLHRDAAIALGIDQSKIILDPGIGFGKTQAHNLALLQNMGLFHSLGCVLLLGASRKRFVGSIGQAENPQERMPGSVAVALHGLNHGVQIVRVHDIVATKQAFRLWSALNTAATKRQRGGTW